MQTFHFIRMFGTPLCTYFNARSAAKITSTLLVCLMLAGALSANVLNAAAQTIPPCASGDIAYRIRAGDTLNKIAARYITTWPLLAVHNHITNPNLIYANATLCIPQSTPPPATESSPSNIPANVTIGTGNYFPQGQCTWWAAERYYQLSGVYVPWTTNSDAWQWTARAQEFGWQVSDIPTVGDIMDMQPDVQGASSLGHVAVVEQVLSNGDVIASSMNWGVTPQQAQQVTELEFTPGPGITFISL